MTLPTIEFRGQRPPNTVILSWWQTPRFCMYYLEEIKKLLSAKRKGKDTGKVAGLWITEQIERYEAIAIGQDWNEERNWPLVWRVSNPDEQILILFRDIKYHPDWLQTLSSYRTVREYPTFSTHSMSSEKYSRKYRKNP